APHLGHAVANFGAAGADVGAMSELILAVHCPARFLAGPAQLGAGAACDDVVRRAAQHEIGARLTDLGAIEEDAEEVDLGEVAAAGRAVLQSHGADGVAVETLLDALLHVVVRLLVGALGLDARPGAPIGVGHGHSHKVHRPPGQIAYREPKPAPCTVRSLCASASIHRRRGAPGSGGCAWGAGSSGSGWWLSARSCSRCGS